MNNNIETAEIIIFQADDKSSLLEVRIEEETVWLTQAQMAELFEASKQNISLHINNVFKEGELLRNSTIKEYLIVQIEGKRKVKRNVTMYNLDVIISIGYRVKSQRGTQFRIWANKVLKEYLLKGLVLNKRILNIEEKLQEHDQKFDLIIKSNSLPTQGIFFDGQVFDAYHFVSGIIKSATKSIVLIDNYVDESVLVLLSKRKSNIKTEVYTSNITKQLKLDIKRFNAQYSEIEVKTFKQAHDRFLIIDNKTVYHIGASLKDLGKKWFAFSKINIDAMAMINKLKLIN
jgi:hypothetical protein